MNGVMTADTVVPGHLGVGLVDVAAHAPLGVDLVPSPDIMAQVPRSWPPNTGCDPAAIVVGDQDPPPGAMQADAQVVAVVAAAAERVRVAVDEIVFVALASAGVPEISAEALNQIADRLSTCAAEQLAVALYIEVSSHEKRELTPNERAALTVALRDQGLGVVR